MAASQSLRAVTTETPCCLTGSHDARVVAERDRHGNPLRTVISTASGLVFTDPRPTPEEVRRFYAEEYRVQYKQTATPKLKHVLRAGRLAKQRLASIADRLTPGCRMLDAGSGGGEFLHAATAAGYDAGGIEPNEGYAQYSINQYGLRVYNGFYQDAPFAEGEFDCVTMFHVLEHLEEPVEALRLLGRWVRPGGTLVVEVPCVDSRETAPGQKWHVGHLYNFSGPTLAATAIRAGFEPVRVGTVGNVFGVFERPESGSPTTSVESVLKGAYETTSRILAEHTALAHYSRPHVPLGRFLSKARRVMDEKSVVRQYESRGPAALLDDLAVGKVA